MEEVPKGWHEMWCSNCKEGCGIMTHYGGTNQLSSCPDCDEVNYQCFDCWNASLTPTDNK